MRRRSFLGAFLAAGTDAAGPAEYPATFAAMRAAGAEGLIIMAHADLNRDKAQLAKLAIEARLPAACEWAEMAEAGCLLGYGPNQKDMRVRLAYYVAQILKGAKPAELPIEQPTRYLGRFIAGKASGKCAQPRTAWD